MHADQDRPAAAGPPARPAVDRRAKSSSSLPRSTSATHHSTSFVLRRSRSRNLRSPGSIASLSDMLSPEEYATLPVNVQKKYFSTKERLCIAQQTAELSRKKRHGKLGSWLSSTSTSDLLSSRPSTSAGLSSLRPKTRSDDSKLFQVRFDDDSITEEEARWFLNLPEKVLAKRFSRSERVSLTARSQKALCKASSEHKRDITQRRRSVHLLQGSACVPIRTASSSSYAASIAPSTSLGSSIDDKAVDQAATSAAKTGSDPTDTSGDKTSPDDTLPAQADQASEAIITASEAEMEVLKLYLQRRSLKPKASESTAKRSPPGSPPCNTRHPTKKRLHHRLHLVPLPLPPPVLAPAPQTSCGTAFSTSARLSRPFLNTDPLDVDEEGQPEDSQLDSEALARAPQTDPEASDGQIFELPANEVPIPPISTDEDCPYPDLVSAFSDDGSDDDDEDGVDDNIDAESVETVGPRTPSPTDHRDSVQPATGDSGVDLANYHLDAGSKSPSVFDRNSGALSSFGSNHDSIGSVGSHARGLRTSSEEILYAYQRRLTSGVDVETSDPLALEALPVSDDQTGASGPFAVAAASQEGSIKAPSKGLRRVLKSFQRL